MFALTHSPSPRMSAAVRTYVDYVQIDLTAARRQHADYCRTLEELGVAVRKLRVNEDHADCTFVEDLAVVLDEAAILASMGDARRANEPGGIEGVLRELREVHRVEAPATIEGGDVLRVDRLLLVGRSRRTNLAGAERLAQIVERAGYRVVVVPVRGCLHLKTACTALADGRLLVNPAWLDVRALEGMHCLPVPADEPWAANTLTVGDRVIMPAGHVRTAEMVGELGFEVVPIEISEFAKAEGGVTCLSILYE